MAPLDPQLEDRLLAYHLGWLQRAEMQRVERLIESSPEVARRSRELQRLLAPLADWDTLPSCDDVEQHILRQAPAPPDDWALADAVRLDPVPPQRGVLRFPLTLREVIAASVAILLLTAVVVPSWARVISQAQRRKCADNLQHIALALSAYRQDHGDHLPLAGHEVGAAQPAANWLRERTPGVPRYRNSQNRYLLAARGYLGETGRYVCPADDGAIVMRVDDPADFDDFPEARNDSYDSQLPLGPARHALDPQLVVYADANPLFDPRAAAGDDPAMSPAHARLSGQNVMRLDGAVQWARSPLVGVQNDDIWRIGRRHNYTGSEVPELPTDSFMIP